MVDWAKKIKKACADDIEPDEQIEAGLFVQPSGMIGRQMGRDLGGIVGSVTVARSQAKQEKKHELNTETGIGANLLDAAHVIGITSRRLLIWGHSRISGKPKGLKLAVPLESLTSISHEEGKLTTRMVLEFNDGSAAIVEAPRIGKPDTFIETFTRLTG